MGKQHLGAVRTSVHKEQMFPGEAGLLGNPLLSNFRFTIDGIRRNKCVHPPEPQHKTSRGSEHLSFAVKPSSAAGFDRTGRANLGCTVALVTTHGKGVFAMLERPLITPDDPRQVR